jgi:hypothetical protein
MSNTGSKSQSALVLNDAIFTSIHVGWRPQTPGRPRSAGRPMSTSALLHLNEDTVLQPTDQYGQMCIISRVSQPGQRYLCTLPPCRLVTYSPAVVYRISLLPLTQQSAGPDAAAKSQCPVTLQTALAESMVPTHTFESDPIPMAIYPDVPLEVFLANTESQQSVEITDFSDHADVHASVAAAGADKDLLRFVFSGMNAVDTGYEPDHLPSYSTSPETSVSLSVRTLLAARVTSTAVAKSLVYRFPYEQYHCALTDALQAAAGHHPVRMFAEGIIDSAAAERHSSAPCPATAEMQDLAALANKMRAIAIYTDTEALQLIDAPLVQLARRHGIIVPLSPRDPDVYVRAASVTQAAWLRECIGFFMRSLEPPATAHSPPTLLRTPSLFEVLAERNFLLLNTHVPLLAQRLGHYQPAQQLEELQALAAVRIQPFHYVGAAAHNHQASAQQLQEHFSRRLEQARGPAPECLPLVLVEDVHLFSLTELWFYLAALHVAPLRAETLRTCDDDPGRFVDTRAAVPFKLVFTYATTTHGQLDREAGTAMTLLSRLITDQRYVMNDIGQGFPPPLYGRATSASDAVGAILHACVSQPADALSTYLYAETRRPGGLRYPLSFSPAAPDDLPTLEADSRQSSIAQLKSAGYLPDKLHAALAEQQAPGPVAYRAAPAVVMRCPYSVDKLMTMICLCSNVIISM